MSKVTPEKTHAILKKIKKLVLETAGNESSDIFLCGEWASDNPGISDEINVVVDANRCVDTCFITNLQEKLENSNIPFKINVLDLNHTLFGLRRDDLQKKVIWKKTSRINTVKIWKQALSSLREAAHQEINPIIRDAMIFRFESCFDLCYKSTATYLKDNHCIVCQTQKKCFRKLMIAELTSPDETELLLEMVDVRNREPECYDESCLYSICDKIVNQYLPLMEGLADKIMFQESDWSDC